MDREAPHFIRQGYLSLHSFAQLRPVSRSFAEPSWCRNQAFLSARFAWRATEPEPPPSSWRPLPSEYSSAAATGAPAVAVMESTEIAPGARFYVGKFARKLQAYMKLKRRIEGRAYAWFCNCRTPECKICALTQRCLLKYLRGEGPDPPTPQTKPSPATPLPSPATPPLDERERSLALPRVLQRAANLAGRELRQPGGVQHERLGVYLEAEAEELSDRTTGEFHSEAGSIAHGTGGHGGSSDGSGGGGGRREAQKQHKEVKARQSAQGGGEK